MPTHILSAVIHHASNAHSNLLGLGACGTFKGIDYQRPDETREAFEARVRAVFASETNPCDCTEAGCCVGRKSAHTLTNPDGSKRKIPAFSLFCEADYHSPDAPHVSAQRGKAKRAHKAS